MTTTTENEEILRTKKKKRGKKSKVVSFDEEIVPKHVADEILLKKCSGKVSENIKKSKKFKRKVEIEQNKDELEMEKQIKKGDNENNSVTGPLKKKKKKKLKELVTDDNNHDQASTIEQEDINITFSEQDKSIEGNECAEKNINTEEEKKKPESIRAQKRKKYAKLLEEKKLKAELAIQQKSLNYLSKWKHSRNEWKFEKLKQIWLQHNMYNKDKIPDEFWKTLVEYFSNSQGKARVILLKDALKIIEENPENEIICKVERARDIIQHLQE